MDVARYKEPPCWVKAAVLHAALRGTDPTSQKSRGFLVVYRHPFSYENWLFQHNGSIPEFSKLKRQLMFDVAPELFPHIARSTDSETLFFRQYSEDHDRIRTRQLASAADPGRLAPDEWGRLSFTNRFLENTFRLASPLLLLRLDFTAKGND